MSPSLPTAPPFINGGELPEEQAWATVLSLLQGMLHTPLPRPQDSPVQDWTVLVSTDVVLAAAMVMKSEHERSLALGILAADVDLQDVNVKLIQELKEAEGLPSLDWSEARKQLRWLSPLWVAPPVDEDEEESSDEVEEISPKPRKGPVR